MWHFFSDFNLWFILQILIFFSLLFLISRTLYWRNRQRVPAKTRAHYITYYNNTTSLSGSSSCHLLLADGIQKAAQGSWAATSPTRFPKSIVHNSWTSGGTIARLLCILTQQPLKRGWNLGITFTVIYFLVLYDDTSDWTWRTSHFIFKKHTNKKRMKKRHGIFNFRIKNFVQLDLGWSFKRWT